MTISIFSQSYIFCKKLFLLVSFFHLICILLVVVVVVVAVVVVVMFFTNLLFLKVIHRKQGRVLVLFCHLAHFWMI